MRIFQQWIPLAAGLLWVALPCSAQLALEVTPVASFYRPLEPIIAAPTVTLTQRQGIAYGARVTLWLGRRIGIDASTAYSSGSASYPSAVSGFCNDDFDAFCPVSTAVYIPGTVRMESVELLIRTTVSSATAAYFGAGPVVVHGSYDARGAYGVGLPLGTAPEMFTVTSTGVILGGGVQARIASSPLAFRVGLEDLLYRATFPALFPANLLTNAPTESSSRLQSDVLVSFGLSLVWARKAER